MADMAGEGDIVAGSRHWGGLMGSGQWMEGGPSRRFGEVGLTRPGDRLGGWEPMVVLVPGVTGQWGPLLNGPRIRLFSI